MTEKLDIKTEADLLRLDYDDVLKLYVGWKKSESSLRERTKEIESMQLKILQLQQSHEHFAHQISALESLKEMTVRLQQKLASKDQDNVSLLAENDRLKRRQIEQEKLLKQLDAREQDNLKRIEDIANELISAKKNSTEAEKTIQTLRSNFSQENALRLLADSRLKAAEESIEPMKEEVYSLRAKLESVTARLKTCDQELAQASDQLKTLTIQVSNINQENGRHDDEAAVFEAEVKILRNDIARLLRLVTQNPAAKHFMETWRASNGMTFLGMDDSQVANGGVAIGTASFASTRNDPNISRRVDASVLGPADDAIDPTMAFNWNDAGITPLEYANLKRAYADNDPFPMTRSFDEELELWVPLEAASKGMKFLSSKLPHVPRSVIINFIRSMNKIWLRREQKKMRDLKEAYVEQIADLKRQLANSRPYKGVIAEKEVLWLKHKIKEKRSKHLRSGRPRSKLHGTYTSDLQDYDSDDQDAAIDISHMPPHQRRLCDEVRAVASKPRGLKGSPEEVSTKKLLEVSLNSLENIGRSRVPQSHLEYLPDDHSQTFSSALRIRHGQTSLSKPDSSVLHGSTSALQRSIIDGGDNEYDDLNASNISSSAAMPSESYLRGAMWLGRNLTVLIEELSGAVDKFRGGYMQEVSSAAQDPDRARSQHRLGALATAGANQTLTLVNRTKAEARSILEGASALKPGEQRAFLAFRARLPVESSYLDTSPAKHKAYKDAVTVSFS